MNKYLEKMKLLKESTEELSRVLRSIELVQNRTGLSVYEEAGWAIKEEIDSVVLTEMKNNREDNEPDPEAGRKV